MRMRSLHELTYFSNRAISMDLEQIHTALFVTNNVFLKDPCISAILARLGSETDHPSRCTHKWVGQRNSVQSFDPNEIRETNEWSCWRLRRTNTFLWIHNGGHLAANSFAQGIAFNPVFPLNLGPVCPLGAVLLFGSIYADCAIQQANYGR